MDPIKEAFDKIKQDIILLKTEINTLSFQIETLKQENLVLKKELNTQSKRDSHNLEINNSPIPTIPTQLPTEADPPISTPTQNPTHQHILEASESTILDSSTGSRGVPTDKPTNRQTNQQTLQQSNNSSYNPTKEASFNSFERASEILNSLDTIKKEIRLKFKQLTSQEMLVFSTLYTLEEQNIEEITYKVIAQHLRLSESSIRDYITKIKSKGIPIFKSRLNNKQITLNISQDLKKVATLSTIMRLRDI